MTPERAAELVSRWVRLYTRGLPEATARRRADEIGADLHDHIAHERGRGTPDRRVALSILSRAARGLLADATWRGRLRPWKGDLMKSFVVILAAALAAAAVGVMAVMYGESDDAPGLVLVGVLLIAGAFVTGVWTARRSGQRSR